MTNQETLEMCKLYVDGRPGAYRQLLFDSMGRPMQPNEYGALAGRPREYWCPCVRIGKDRHPVIGPNEDGSSGAPVGYYSRKAATDNAARFLARCREILEKHRELTPQQN